jgi:DUF971 family protein
MPTPQPVEIKRLTNKGIRITWDNGHAGEFTAPYLRRQCPCAQCVHEMTGQRLLDPRTVPDDLTMDGLELVGSYALRFQFSDLHGTGIYPFELLWKLCPCGQHQGASGRG